MPCCLMTRRIKRHDPEIDEEGGAVGLNGKTLISCFFRTYLVGAAFNTRGMQNIGLSYAMDPGLSALYADGKRLRRARKRYLRHYNTHPFWTPMLVGFFLFLEGKISQNLLPEESLSEIKGTTVYTLSAIGDSFFGASLFVFWSLSTALLALHGLIGWALGWTALWIVCLQLFKGYTFLYGFKDGLSFLQRLKRWDLINWAGRVKIANALLLVILWVTVFPSRAPWVWFPSVSILCVAAFAGARFYLAKEILFILFIMASAIILSFK